MSNVAGRGIGPESREVVTTVEIFARLRPSARASVCSPVFSVAPSVIGSTAIDTTISDVSATGWLNPVARLAKAMSVHACVAQAFVGEGAVQIEVRTAPTSRYAAFHGAQKINNYMTTSAMGEGLTLSIADVRTVSELPVVTVREVKGGDARGIPPRGRPV